jgi:hypothetical protein
VQAFEDDLPFETFSVRVAESEIPSGPPLDPLQTPSNLPLRCVQAFEDDLPFETFSVRVAESEIPRLPEILEAVTPEDRLSLQVLNPKTLKP